MSIVHPAGGLIFADSSAFVTLIDRDQPGHRAAADWFRALPGPEGPRLVTSSLVVVETTAVLQVRLGMELAVAFHDDLLPLFAVDPVDARLLEAGITFWRAARRRGLSLVDSVSFELMRREGITRAFAFDRHFREAGFELVPEEQE